MQTQGIPIALCLLYIIHFHSIPRPGICDTNINICFWFCPENIASAWSNEVYKKAATKAPTPTTDPATARIVAAAPVDCELLAEAELLAPAPEPEARALVPVGLAEAPDPDAPLPVAPPAPIVLRITVVLLLAETTMVCVELGPAVPWTGTVWMPGLTAGMEAGAPTFVLTAGCDDTAGGWAGIEEAGAGCPVTTPRELVCWRNEVWGKSSPDD